MTYFTRDHHNAVLASLRDDPLAQAERERAFNHMRELHKSLYPLITQHRLSLHPNVEVPGGVAYTTTVSAFEVDALSLTYMRSAAEAEVVEGMMGRDGVSTSDGLRARHHPVIELRLTPDHFAVELVVAPFAWYDQQNFAGKLTISQHRSAFFELLRELDDNYRLGFWSGIHPGEMNLEIEKLPPQTVLFEFLDTFAAGRDWLRIGRWYGPEDDNLNGRDFKRIVLQHIQSLYGVYEFIIWSSNNNFQTFFNKASSRT
ncbi:MAG: hypothetical protein ACOCX3_01670 [Chloroflexota bacterium]